jgi:hypothetical protein
LQTPGIAMAVLTNKPLEQSVRILDAFDLSKHFQWVVGGDGPWPRKPAPDGMQFLMKQADADQPRPSLWGILRSICRRHGTPAWESASRVMDSDSSTLPPAACAATNGSSTHPPRFPECWVHIDNAGWSGEGVFTQVVVDRLSAIDTVALLKSKTRRHRSEADYNFIANEIFVTFATRVERSRSSGSASSLASGSSSKRQ